MDIVDLISNLGFPFTCVIGLGYYVRELTNQHREEVKELSKAIDNNTLIITKMYEHFKRTEEEDE